MKINSVLYRPVHCVDGVWRIERVFNDDGCIVVGFCGFCVSKQQCEDMCHRLNVRATGSELIFE